ncbi:MAG: Stp1/IreP family PP2C-type Ser/Thr phosphatase, partial [Nitrospirae bacterium]|nr:Stp1/IreP family PP2C-type Ser/Thr phosphatase [Nitrospirota bacterium]
HSNEDAYGIYPDLSLYIVADGLGGHAGGEVASRIAVEAIKECIASTDNASLKIRDSVITAINEANLKILSEAGKEKNLHGMGTTVAVVMNGGNTAIVAHVGDSRVYLVRGDVITRITKDHTIVEEYIRLGLLTPQDALYHPSKYMLSRALGTSGDVDVDITELQFQAGDTLILCTDGLTNMVSDKEISDVILELSPSPEKITDKLIALATKNGGIDNITVITICAVDQVGP